MAKQDVLDAINATIVPNNLKGINADSLRNILTMIVENVGEGGSGSGDGALRVIVPEIGTMGLAGLFEELGGFTPEAWEEIRTQFAGLGIDTTEYDNVMASAFEHNAQVYQTLIEKANAGESILCMVDQSPTMKPAILEMFRELGPDKIVEIGILAGQMAQVQVLNLKVTPDVEDVFPSQTGVVIIPIDFMPEGFEDVVYYQSDTALMLQPDGSILFVPTTEEPEQEPES